MRSMSNISLAEAGKLTGLHKVSILRAIRKGKITAEKDEHGEWRIQPAELFRIYPPLPEQRNGNGGEQHYAASLNGALDAEISALKQVNQICVTSSTTCAGSVTSGSKPRRQPCVSYRRRKHLLVLGGGRCAALHDA